MNLPDLSIENDINGTRVMAVSFHKKFATLSWNRQVPQNLIQKKPITDADFKRLYLDGHGWRMSQIAEAYGYAATRIVVLSQVENRLNQAMRLVAQRICAIEIKRDFVLVLPYESIGKDDRPSNLVRTKLVISQIPQLFVKTFAEGLKKRLVEEFDKRVYATTGYLKVSDRDIALAYLDSLSDIGASHTRFHCARAITREERVAGDVRELLSCELLSCGFSIPVAKTMEANKAATEADDNKNCNNDDPIDSDDDIGVHNFADSPEFNF